MFASFARAQTRTTAVESSGSGPVAPGKQGTQNGSTGVDSGVTTRSDALTGSLPGGAAGPNVQTSDHAVENAAAAGEGAAVVSEAAVQSLKKHGLAPKAAAQRSQQALSGSPSRGEGASSALGGAGTRIQKSRAEEGRGDDFALQSSLDAIFDTARRASAQAPGASAPAVAGKVLRVEAKIKQTVAVANTAASADAPSLYQAAIAAAKDAFSPDVAGSIAKAVLRSADKKAETALPDLANQAYAAAAAGSSAAVAKAFKAFTSWDRLLGGPDRPLIGNYAHLKSDVERTLKQASSRKDAASRAAAKVWFKRDDGFVRRFTAMLPTTAVAAVPQGLAQDLAIKEEAFQLLDEEGLWRAFRADPSAVNMYAASRRAGSSVAAGAWDASRYWLKTALEAFWKLLSRIAAKIFGGVQTAAPLSGAIAESTVKGRDFDMQIVTRGADAKARADAAIYLEKISGLSAEVAAVDRLIAAGAGDLRATRRALSQTGKAAAQFEALTQDDSPRKAVASLSAFLEKEAARLGLSESEVLPGSLSKMIFSNGGLSLSYWAGRMRAEALWSAAPGIEAFAALTATERGGLAVVRYRTPAPAADGARARAFEDLGFAVSYRDDAAQAALTGRTAALSADEVSERLARALTLARGESLPARSDWPVSVPALERLLADVKARPAAAEKTALLLQSIDPSPERYVTIARVGTMLAQQARRKDRSGRPVSVTVLRDQEQGLVAFARAESLDGKPKAAEDIVP